MKGNFQIIVIVVFIALAVIGVLVFSGAIPIGKSSGGGSLGTVVLWGTEDKSTMTPLLEKFNNTNPTLVVKYEQKSPESFDQDLLEALAEGTGPDLILLPDGLAYHYANKIRPIPYASYPLTLFKNNFAGAGEVFLTSRGILAFPLSINPLLMYYNRSIFDASKVVYPPSFWDEFAKLVPAIIVKDDANKIIRSAVALGHFSNIIHAKDIVSALFMQGGNPIVAEKGGVFSSSLSTTNKKYDLGAILKFYTDFADPNQDVYSWNKSFRNSDDAFSAENLAIYFGYADELVTLISRNPNQNLAVAPFPQIRNASFKLTGAHVTGIAILASSKNFTGAFTAASLMAKGDFANKYALATGVAPARRDLLARKQTDAYSPIFYDSALYARSWLDPSSAGTDNIFSNMIEGVLSNSMNVESAITEASGKLDLLLKK
ncbi:MAG TPA: extracellular solute-binding protein [Candidatus Paceibacterota bacterium]|nr:extracellular solute-binding protein [Candidatus Paceibacterota bacterium]